MIMGALQRLPRICLDTNVHACVCVFVSQFVRLCVRKRKSSGRMRKKCESCLMLDYGDDGNGGGHKRRKKLLLRLTPRR